MAPHHNVRIEIVKPRPGRVHLGLPDRAGAVENLAVEVGFIDDVVVDQSQGSDAGGSKIQGDG